MPNHAITPHSRITAAQSEKVAKTQLNYLSITLVTTFICLLSFFCALSYGAADISFSDVWQSFFPEQTKETGFIDRIIWELRMPRAILAFLAGCGLAISGLILQTVTRNPLADPYLFGISSGASLGVVMLITFTGGMFTGLAPIAAFIGSLLAMVMLMLIAGRRQSQQVESMLLAGVALSFLFSSITNLLLYHTDPQAVTAVLFWTLGSFSRAQWENLLFPTIVISVCITIMLAYRRQLNAMLLGDESATTLGINVNRFRLIMLLLSSLITATLVSMCGGIGFVGLMIPHIVRFFISQGSMYGILLTALVGGIFMLWVDILSRTVLENQELPVGVITAATGSLFFLTLLYFRKNRPN
ncbi:FecCD family ABC transporter permease [Litorilituus lipolyticus]|uniref:Iron ABC transporter permease n=1 Tax=Litorilituus lipolyticus TaxID=2491017 RepID=A0A502L173_9GAMM|nr:iron ABC transporter permease [Litorilituus lipolyticus]TPH15733.1 iron ABC transporter permease [Litorilituus lipolyticus]